jgi:hypothetical protein
VGTGVAGFESKLDGGSFAAATSPQNFSGLANGSHTFTVRAIDNAGNVDPVGASFTWNVATTPVNHPPVGGTVTIQRNAAESTKVKVADLLASSSDPDGDAITLTAVQSPSPGGATVTISGNWVLYLPPPGLVTSDSFSFTVTDTHGASGTGTVMVNIASNNGQSMNQLSIQSLGGTKVRITFNGIPGRTYRVQFTTSLVTPNWQLVGSATTDASGVLTIDDDTGGVARFYRTVFP